MTTNFLDVVWLTVCGVLVFIMQAGFLCLEAGSTRGKNRINVTIKNLTDLGLSVLIFWAVGYGLMFGNSFHGGIGVDRFFPNFGENKDIWTGSFFLFQAMFCSTAVTILSGATAERIQFRGYMAIATVISGFIYPVFGHWVWQGIDRGLPGGWLAEKGFVDFGGSTTVHSLGGWCALATVLVIGPRIGRFSTKRQYEPMNSTDVPLAFLGTMLLWFGWFGFNGGSNLIFNAHVSNVIANTLMGGAAGVLTPIFVMTLMRRPIEVTPMMNGAIAGLVAVTAGADSYSSTDAVLVSAIGSIVMMLCAHLLIRCRIDDVVGAIPVHLAAGLWGTLAVGLFGNLDRLETGLNRLEQIQVQIEGILACGIWAFSLTLIVVLVFHWLKILRVSLREEYIGLNITEHGAASTINDVYSVMRHHAKTGDLTKRVKIDAFTEVGRVGRWYNQVITALEAAVVTNDAIIKTAMDGILTVSCDRLEIISINPAAAKMFGLLPNHLIDTPFSALFANAADLSASYLEESARKQKPEQLIAQDASGHSFPVEMSVTPTAVSNSRFFTVFLKDVSDRQQAEDALIESRAKERARAVTLEQTMAQLKRTQASLIQRERIAGQGQLVAGIAHEINNPVNFIHGNLDHAQAYIKDLLEALELYERSSLALPIDTQAALKDELEELDIDYIAADYSMLFSSMQLGTERIRTIVQQLRNFSRYDESEIKSVDLHTSLDSTLMVLSHRLEATSRRPAIKVIKRYGQLPELQCYASALNRAFFNIIINAIDAFDREANKRVTHGNQHVLSDPKITIKTNASRKGITITIGNNGPHITAEDKKRIFDPFFTTQPVGKGTGLGCTISHQIIVEQHHGQLSCYSEQDKQTLFIIELPIDTVATSSPNAATSQLVSTSPST